jgi:hypothetical protein
VDTEAGQRILSTKGSSNSSSSSKSRRLTSSSKGSSSNSKSRLLGEGANEDEDRMHDQ